MNDLIMMLITAMGAVAGATAILGALGLATFTVAGSVGGVAALAAAATPPIILMGGVAYAASQTGFGARG